MRDMVLILNFDGACSRAVARSLRAERVYCKIVPGNIAREEVAAQEPLGLILAGGVTGAVPGGMDPRLLQGTWPVLALGDTAGMLCRELGGDALETAIGSSVGTVTFAQSPLTAGMEECERMLRNVRRLRLPALLREIARGQDATLAFSHVTLPIYGVLFTLEPNDTDGMQLLLNYVLGVCGCTRWWDEAAFVERAEEEIRRVVGKGRAVCAMTGGLSSGVTALLARRALGGQLQCVFIDTGLMREREGANFLAYYRDQLGISVTHVQAQEKFLEALRGVESSLEKRRIIGELLQSTLTETVAGLGDFDVVLRSTTCDDVLSERDLSRRPRIRADLPVIEPLRELFKDEVRRAGEFLGMPQEVLQRQTFPGSGLALRILGEVTPARLQAVRACEQIFSEEVAAAGQGKRVWQSFALLSAMPGDDARVMIVLRAVNAGEASQQAYAARLSYDLLEQVTTRILRERPEVARVVYDLTPAAGKGGVEWQ
ncbi:MAG: hypothetical protein IJS53_01390 [Clostridia bacterium]|nr:hypothetical protein [Clostridia bacterium]